MSAYKGYKFMLWDSQSIEKLLEDYDQDLLRCYHDSKSYAQKSDIARYAIVFLHGGLYLDSDYKCHKPLTTLLGHDVDLFYVPFQDVAGLRVINGLFGCKAGHPLMTITMDNLKKRFKEGGTVTYTTGTRLLYDSILEYHDAYPHDNRYIVFSHLQLFPCNTWDQQEECNTKWRNVSFMSHMNEGSWNPVLFTLIRLYVQYKVCIYTVLVLMIAIVLLLVFKSIKK